METKLEEMSRRISEAAESLLNFGGTPYSERFCEAVEALATLNDDLWNMRSTELIKGQAQKVLNAVQKILTENIKPDATPKVQERLSVGHINARDQLLLDVSDTLTHVATALLVQGFGDWDAMRATRDRLIESGKNFKKAIDTE